MVPVKDVAAHSWISPTARVTRILIFTVVGSGIELAPDPHWARPATVCPLCTVPARVSLILSER